MLKLHAFAGTSVAVVGLGSSGLAAARALHAGGARVHAWDDVAGQREVAAEAGLPVTDPAGMPWPETALLVLAPGIPHHHPEPHPAAAMAREAGVPIVCDVELLARAHPEATVVGVTGTNGKSTTTALIGHILAHAGRAPRVGGNLGHPVAAFDPPAPDQPLVLELSSYQLERAPSLHCRVAVLTMIAPDHLDRHGGMDGYAAAKRAVFAGQTAADTAVVGVDDPHAREIAATLDGPAVTRVSAAGGNADVRLDGTALVDARTGERVMDVAEAPALPGAHNRHNAAAAYAACRALGVPAAEIAAAIRTFPGLPHRQETVAVIDGVTFVNDSKATNGDAAARALTSYDAVHWIVGGRAKADGLSATESHRGAVRAAYTIGEAGDAFADTLGEECPTHRCGTLDAAVAAAFAAARHDAAAAPVVLFSPACASFDQYADFAARGDHFKALVAGLPGTNGEPAREVAP